MALVALFLFSSLGFVTALVGVLGFGFTLMGGFLTYLTLALFGPAILVPLSRILGRIGAPDESIAGI